MKFSNLKPNMSLYQYDDDIQVGDIRLNEFTKHPCCIVDKPIEIFKVIGITSSPTTNGKANILLRNPQYLRNHFDYISRDKVLNKYPNYPLDDKSLKLLNSVNNDPRFSDISKIDMNKIK